MPLNHAKIRLALLAISVAMTVLCFLSFWMRRFYDRNSVIAAMFLCAAYAVFRSIHGDGRRQCRSTLLSYYDTPMALSPCIWPAVKAGMAWALLDAAWLSMGACAALTCGIPGVFIILFHGLFFTGFSAAPEVKPDLYDSGDKRHSMDMLEGILYTQACAAMAVACVLFIEPV